MSFFTIFLIWIGFMIITSKFNSLKKKNRGNEIPEIKELQDTDADFEELNRGKGHSSQSRPMRASQQSKDISIQQNKLIRENASSYINTLNQTAFDDLNREKDLTRSGDLARPLSSQNKAYELNSEQDLKRAFVWSEILRRKY